MEDNHWHTKQISQVIAELRSSENGLRNDEVISRRAEYGPNKLPDTKVDSFFIIFLRQFQSPLIYILLAASAVIFLTEEAVDALIILAILFFNAIVGTVQEGKAQNTLSALKKFVSTKATVLREGVEMIISDEELVPGDILILQEGERIAADARVMVSHTVIVDEAALTGESLPVHKIAGLEHGDDTHAQYKNMVYKGTHVVSANGMAVVVATGVHTMIGAIAGSVATVNTDIPLKNNIRDLSRFIIYIAVGISGGVFAIGALSGRPLGEMFAVIVSLLVAIVPEGLPIVVTLILAFGVRRMSKRNALVKKLQAVEALGQARIIAVDKTGTITKNEQVVETVYVDGQTFTVEGNGYEPVGRVQLDGRVIDAVNHPELLLAGNIAARCAGARVAYADKEKRWFITGDPTEAALLVFAQKIGFHKEDLERESVMLGEIPFDYQKKYHATLHRSEGHSVLSIVGAPEVILQLSRTIRKGGEDVPLTAEDQKKMESVFFKFSEQGLRVVACATIKHKGDLRIEQAVRNLTFVGFFGMKDGLRLEALSAIQKAEHAGVKVVMITGDHTVTARSIAKEIGIWHEHDDVLTGADVDALTDIELSKKLHRVSVFARVTPTHKMRIIDAYRARGEIVAMTGDGVNDAPSLVAADLGVAMGNIGTEVAKEAADIVLLDDNLESIVSAIEEGRGIYKTIKKVILYLFSTNMGEVLIIIGAIFLGMPIPMLAAQIIWLNFVTDGFLDVSLAMEPKDRNLLEGTFKKPNKYLVDKLMLKRMVLMSGTMAVGALYVFSRYYEADIVKGWTMSLTTLAVFQWCNAWNCRSDSISLFAKNPFSNMYLVGATVVVAALHMAALYTPFMNKVLKTVPLTLRDWVLVFSVASTIIVVEEVRKFFLRKQVGHAQVT